MSAPELPPSQCYRPIGELLAAVDEGQTFRPVTVDQIRSVLAGNPLPALTSRASATSDASAESIGPKSPPKAESSGSSLFGMSAASSHKPSPGGSSVSKPSLQESPSLSKMVKAQEKAPLEAGTAAASTAADGPTADRPAKAISNELPKERQPESHTDAALRHPQGPAQQVPPTQSPVQVLGESQKLEKRDQAVGASQPPEGQSTRGHAQSATVSSQAAPAVPSTDKPAQHAADVAPQTPTPGVPSTDTAGTTTSSGLPSEIARRDIQAAAGPAGASDAAAASTPVTDSTHESMSVVPDQQLPIRASTPGTAAASSSILASSHASADTNGDELSRQIGSLEASAASHPAASSTASMDQTSANNIASGIVSLRLSSSADGSISASISPA